MELDVNNVRFSRKKNMNMSKAGDLQDPGTHLLLMHDKLQNVIF